MLIETGMDDEPYIITHVGTTLASTTDDAMTETIHQHLQANDPLPAEHLLDSGDCLFLLVTAIFLICLHN